MYHRILVTVDHSPADETILAHVRALAQMTRAQVLLLHVADGWAARHFDELELRESEEMKEDREYLERLAADWCAAGLRTEWRLGRGDPAAVIIETAQAEHVDLVAMATHGHRLLNDLIRGTTVNRVRHELSIPVLLIKAKPSMASA